MRACVSERAGGRASAWVIMRTSAGASRRVEAHARRSVHLGGGNTSALHVGETRGTQE